MKSIHELRQELMDSCEEYQMRYQEKSTITKARDRLGNLKDLVNLCVEGLLQSELIDIKKMVAHILYFQVREQLEIADEELSIYE